MRVDDSQVIKEHIEERLGEVKTEMVDKLKTFNKSTNRQFEKITGESLQVPDLIGPGDDCQFKNLKEWVQFSE